MKIGWNRNENRSKLKQKEKSAAASSEKMNTEENKSLDNKKDEK